MVLERVFRLFAGATDLAIEHFKKSLRLDPRTPLRLFHDTGLGALRFMPRRLDEAAALLVGSLRQVPTYVTTSWVLASCYGHMGRLDDARRIVDHLRDIGSPIMPPPTCCSANLDSASFSSRACGAPLATQCDWDHRLIVIPQLDVISDYHQFRCISPV